jgi:hypothetical protein
MLMRCSTLLAAVASIGLTAAIASAGTIETYDDGTDIGIWNLTTNLNKPRLIQPSGGNPGKFLEQDDVAGGLPQWETATPQWQPGFNDTYKNFSAYTGNYAAAGVSGMSMDVNVIQQGNWATDRAPTLKLARWDDVNQTVLVEATYTGPDLPDDIAPVGWNNYAFPIDSAATDIPAGWVVDRGDGQPATGADWVALMNRVDLATFGFYKPGFFYSSLGSWSEGIDNIAITSVPEPASIGALGLVAFGFLRRAPRASSRATR